MLLWRLLRRLILLRLLYGLLLLSRRLLRLFLRGLLLDSLLNGLLLRLFLSLWCLNLHWRCLLRRLLHNFRRCLDGLNLNRRALCLDDLRCGVIIRGDGCRLGKNLRDRNAFRHDHR